MHRLIHVLVEAVDEKIAVRRAETHLDKLLDRTYYDRYNRFPNTHCSNIQQSAYPLESERGKELLGRGWKSTADRFEKEIEIIREIIADSSNEELFRVEGNTKANKLCVRTSTMNKFTMGDGVGMHLYHLADEGAISYLKELNEPHKLRWALEDTENMWIVPMDMHY